MFQEYKPSRKTVILEAVMEIASGMLIFAMMIAMALMALTWGMP